MIVAMSEPLYGTPRPHAPLLGPLAPVLVRSTTAGQPDAETLRALGAGEPPGEFYQRLSHHNGRAVESLVAELEGADGAVAFEIEAQNWRAPIGPGHVWATLSASGRAAGQALVVDSYTASSSAGVVQGALVAASDVAWSVAGTARSVSVDLETVMRQLSGARPDDPAAPRPPLQGTATVTLFGSGHGPSLADATFGARMAGPVSVRWATLNGINLGLAATQGGVSETGGGNTRFTELSALAEFSDAGLVLRDIDGRAGAMATRGQVTIAPDLALTGALRVDLGATRVQAPATLRVAGTAVAPRYGRQ